jgi:hypothetical protein
LYRKRENSDFVKIVQNDVGALNKEIQYSALHTQSEEACASAHLVGVCIAVKVCATISGLEERPF